MPIEGVTESYRVCFEPLYYKATNLRHRSTLQTLQKCRTIDEDGNPVVPTESTLSYKDRDKAQREVNKFVTDIYRLNKITQRLLQDERTAFIEELTKFNDLSNDPVLQNAITPKIPQVKTESSGNKEPLEFNLDMSPKAQAARARLNEKRKMMHEMYLTTPFIPMFGMAGLIMTGTPYSSLVIYNLGINHDNNNVQNGALTLLDAEVKTLEQDYFADFNNPDPFLPPREVLANDTSSNLWFIFELLSGLRYDVSSKIQQKSREIQANIIDTSKKIKASLAKA